MLLSSGSCPVQSPVLASIVVPRVTLLLYYFCSVEEKRIKVFRADNPDSLVAVHPFMQTKPAKLEGD